MKHEFSEAENWTKPPRTLLWDRGSVWDPIIRNLQDERICEVVLRFAFEQKGTHYSHSFYSGEFTNPAYQGGGSEIYDKVYEALPRFIDMNCRNSGYDTTTYYNEKTFHDHLHLFNQLFDYFYNLVVANKIELIIFSRVPHLGADFILYLIAQYLGIRSLFFWQSLFPARFFFCYHWDDFGDFREVPQLSDPVPFHIERRHEREWHSFYKPQPPPKIVREQWQRTLKRLRDPQTRSETLSHLTSARHYLRFLDQKMDQTIGLRFVKDLLTREMRGQALFRYQNERRYYRDMRRFAGQFRPDMNYVYFPLHLQPEATTSALGHIYFDQALAIERLSKLLPSDWLIYIKDNPVQNSTMRGRWFFRRLQAVKNAVIVPTETDTFALIGNSRFVCTITGTAGWEAISGGKNVLTFGQALVQDLTRRL